MAHCLTRAISDQTDYYDHTSNSNVNFVWTKIDEIDSFHTKYILRMFALITRQCEPAGTTAVCGELTARKAYV